MIKSRDPEGKSHKFCVQTFVQISGESLNQDAWVGQPASKPAKDKRTEWRFEWLPTVEFEV